MACNQFPWLGCPDCCTHRLIDSAASVAWSLNADSAAYCEKCRKTVIESCYAGGTYYLLVYWQSADIQVHNSVQAWSSSGDKLWETEISTGTANTSGCITSDGTNVWASINPTSTKIWRLDATSGTIEDDSPMSGGLTPNGLTASGGSVYVAHAWQDIAEDGNGFVSLWFDGVVLDRFGAATCDTSPVAYCVSEAGGAVFVGHGFYSTDDFGIDGECCVPGFVSRYESGVLKWISPYDLSDEIDDIDPVLIKVSGDTIYWVIRGTPFYGTMDVDDGQVKVAKVLDFGSGGECGDEPAITDMDADGSNIWITACRWAYVLDATGTIDATRPHVSLADYVESFPFANVLRTVACDGAGNALIGGKAVKCAVSDLETKTEHDASCADVVACDPHEWCHPADCGIIATNGRVAIAECARDKWPPCNGSLHVEGDGCETFSEDRPVTGVGCVDGTWTWSAVSAVECAAGVPRWEWGLSYTCDGGPVVEFQYGGVDADVTNVELVCDGPNGYAAIYFDWSTEDAGSCCEGSMSGCGAMNADECAVSFCGCDGVPKSLTATLSGCHSTTVAMAWNGTGFSGTFDCSGCTATVFLECTGDVPQIGTRAPGCVACESSGSASVTCSPFEATRTFSLGGGCGCCAGGSLTVTITE